MVLAMDGELRGRIQGHRDRELRSDAFSRSCRSLYRFGVKLKIARVVWADERLDRSPTGIDQSKHGLRGSRAPKRPDNIFRLHLVPSDGTPDNVHGILQT